MSEDRHSARDRSDPDDSISEPAPLPPAEATDAPQAVETPAKVWPAIPRFAPLGRLLVQRRRFTRWWRGATPNLRGSVFMLSSMLVYAVMTALMKHLGPSIPLVQMLVIRQIIMTIILMAFAARQLPLALRSSRPGLQVLRGTMTLASMLFGFSAIFYIPLAQATAIGFSQVLFVTIAAVIVLKEIVDTRRWVATAVGFIGVVIMLNPSADGLDIYALMSVAGALFGAAVTVSVRKLAMSERTDTILIYQGIIIIVLLGVPTWLWWVKPTTMQWVALVILSLFGTAGQWLLTRAYQVGEAAALAPLDFTRLLIASFTGYVFFSEIPALSTWIGAAFVIGATLYTVRKNARTQSAS